jgi:hypothetical protein
MAHELEGPPAEILQGLRPDLSPIRFESVNLGRNSAMEELQHVLWGGVPIASGLIGFLRMRLHCRWLGDIDGGEVISQPLE